jgi:hypothetical protein
MSASRLPALCYLNNMEAKLFGKVAKLQDVRVWG